MAQVLTDAVKQRGVRVIDHAADGRRGVSEARKKRKGKKKRAVARARRERSGTCLRLRKGAKLRNLRGLVERREGGKMINKNTRKKMSPISGCSDFAGRGNRAPKSEERRQK